MDYRPKGVCSQQIHFDIVDNKVRNVSFKGGCNGNLQGISRLIEGMDVDEAISRIDGIRWPSPALTGSAADSNQHPARISLHRH